MSHVSQAYDFGNPEAAYAELARDLRALLSGERDLIANAANTAALIWEALPGLNWAGFYLYKSGELVLGPFQGKPACVRIAIGKGVCGTAAAKRATVAGRRRARLSRPHRLRFGFEFGDRDTAAARRGTARRAGSGQPAARALRAGRRARPGDRSRGSSSNLLELRATTENAGEGRRPCSESGNKNLASRSCRARCTRRCACRYAAFRLR